MRIGIDARLWGTANGGIGRYTEELVRNLQKLDNKNQYVVFCRRENYNEIPNKKNWSKVSADIKHYSLNEQVKLVAILYREKLDLLHVPHFNVPLFYKKPFVVTIHDILWHQFRGFKATTLSAPVYLIKHYAYKIVIKNAVKNAKKILVPSKTIKQEIKNQFLLNKNKIVVTYEGVSKMKFGIETIESSTLKKYKIDKPYFFYVGNLYPHKNVESVVLALKILNPRFQIQDSKFNLVVVCGRDIFWRRFKKFLQQNKAENFVNLIGHVTDKELSVLYKNAKAFIFPSLSEGFGLPGLEAMAAGVPVLASDIPVFKEIYGNAAIYFNPKDIKDITKKIKEVLHFSDLKRKNIIKKGREKTKVFSWQKMAGETLKVYENCIGL